MSHSIEHEGRGVSRRSFLKGSVLAGAVIAGSGLAGCATGAPSAYDSTGQDSIEWDKEADFVLVGSGSGLAGAVAALCNGASTIVLEKASTIGGSTVLSAGAVWVPNSVYSQEYGDSRENALKYLACLRGDQGDEKLSEAFVDNAQGMLDLLNQAAGVEWKGDTASDYHPEWDGGMKTGHTVIPVKGEDGTMAQVLIGKMADAIESMGGEILTDTPALELVTERTDAGTRVVGVKAGKPSSPIMVKANKGVLLATGGYEWNETLKNNFLRGKVLYNQSVSTNTGDGLRMAMAIGADLANMNDSWNQVCWKADSEVANSAGGTSLSTAATRQKPGSIIVNGKGKRFCNEASDYDTLGRMFYAFENWGDCSYANLPAWFVCDDDFVQKFGIGGSVVSSGVVGKSGSVSVENIIIGETVADLATKIDIDPDALTATVERFNMYAEQGIDPDFHRGESYADCSLMADSTDPEIYGTPAATLRPLTTPPFYAVEVSIATLGTCGGPKVNENAQVVDTNGNPIDGLYASGNCAGIGAPGCFYSGPGGTIGSGLTFAMIAGNHATKNLSA